MSLEPLTILAMLGSALFGVPLGVVLMHWLSGRTHNAAAGTQQQEVARREARETAAALRQEVVQSITTLGESLSSVQASQRELLDTRLSELRDVFQRTGVDLRGEINQALESLGTQQRNNATQLADQQKERLASFAEQLGKLTETLSKQLEKLREENAKSLDDMRQTVDEKLQSTLEKRLNESFNLVSKQLKAVHEGLGEMQNLATGVGDLRRVLTNVRTRGTWGEVQLARLLEDMLTADQFATNVEVIPGSGKRVEFAIRLPGRSDSNVPVWLPIDVKFPKEDYERLQDAAQAADPDGVEAASKALEKNVLQSARDIATKYLAPPHSTDFAVLYLPTEGLYAEIAKQPGLIERVQRQHRIIFAGPSTFSAILNSLQMGFRTLAIEKRSGEVWQVLSEVKTEFGKFGAALDAVHKKLEDAGKQVDALRGTRTRVMDRKLRDVAALPTTECAARARAHVGGEQCPGFGYRGRY